MALRLHLLQAPVAARGLGVPVGMSLTVYTVTADGTKVPRPAPAPADRGTADLSPVSLTSAFPPCGCPACRAEVARVERRGSGVAS